MPSKYVAMIRAANPSARILYNVADLHFLRMLRESDLIGSAELRAAAEDMRQLEMAAAASVDQVIVHSSYEAATLLSLGSGLAGEYDSMDRSNRYDHVPVCGP